VFDLFMLSSQAAGRPEAGAWAALEPAVRGKAAEQVLSITLEQFRDTVVSFLSPDDQAVYQETDAWEDIKLRVVHSLEEPEKDHA